MKRIIIYGSIFLTLLFVAAFTQRAQLQQLWREWQQPDVEAVAYEEIGGATTPREEEVTEETNGTEDVEEIIEEEVEEPISETDSESQLPNYPVTQLPTYPTEYNLAVPITSQAPHGNWVPPYKEACEEASALMAAFYFQKEPDGQIDPETADEEILRIVAFEDTFFGYNADTTAAETALLIENYYHLTTELVMNPTADQLKEQIAAGYPIIMPAAGRQLGNPYFTAPGPRYHMLVIKGYTEEGFITNDTGTRHGEDYFYSTDVLLNAIHDWNGGEVELGEKVVIVVKP